MYHKPLGNSGDAEPGSFRQPIAWRQIQFLFMILEIGRMGGDVGVRDLSGCCELFLKTQRNTGGERSVDLEIQVGCVQRERNAPVPDAFQKWYVAMRSAARPLRQNQQPAGAVPLNY